MTSVIAVLILLLFVLAFGAGLLYLVSLVGPKPKFSELKSTSYECGLPVQETGHSKIPVKFYLTAILFILFDIEIIFMYPWAISLVEFIEAGQGAQVLLAMGFFLLVFIFGLVWEIKSKALEWE
jgi:NADH-quinone oxidoreductase subunit A